MISPSDTTSRLSTWRQFGLLTFVAGILFSQLSQLNARTRLNAAIACLVTSIVAAGCGGALQEVRDVDTVGSVVDTTIRQLMAEHAIPGMAVAVIADGKPHFFDYGVASKSEGAPVDDDTLFEVGSLSKTFTATLAGYAQARGTLSLSEPASAHWPALHGTAFDRISMVQLGTYSAGGLPLQFPAEADNPESMLGYFRHWDPSYPPGSRRLYSNPSLGLFGYLAARSLGGSFADLMQNTLLPQLGLNDTYIQIPSNEMAHYAQGYTKTDAPTRVTPGALDAETYGIKTTTHDLVQFVTAAMQPDSRDDPWRRAIETTQTGYYRVNGMTQGLGWEIYPRPFTENALIEGNSDAMASQSQPIDWLDTPSPPDASALFNKTGSTNGFGSYVAYIPQKRLAVILLANKNYPNSARVDAAYRILKSVGHVAE